MEANMGKANWLDNLVLIVSEDFFMYMNYTVCDGHKT